MPVMTPKEVAQARIEGRARRIRLIRRRIAAGAVGLFSVAWAVIGVQLVTGHDPALAKQTTTSTQATNNTSQSTNSSSPSSGSSTQSSGSSTQSSSNSSQAGSSVTTRQS
jgi:cytoskeletal protein RodZ